MRIIYFLLCFSHLAQASTQVEIALTQISEKHLLTKIVVKEYCSCRFNSGLTPEQCLGRTGAPEALARAVNPLEHLLPNGQIEVRGSSVTDWNYSVRALYNPADPRHGCHLLAD